MLQIQENPYLLYFCGNPRYDDSKLPFAPSLMTHFRKCLKPKALGEINETNLRDVAKAEEKDKSIDATCAQSNIRYPQDVSLLNSAMENAEKLLDVLHDLADGIKSRTYRKRAQKDSLKYSRNRKHTVKETREAIRKQLNYLKRDLEAVDAKLALGK